MQQQGEFRWAVLQWKKRSQLGNGENPNCVRGLLVEIEVGSAVICDLEELGCELIIYLHGQRR
jgi:hypothetical protein